MSIWAAMIDVDCRADDPMTAHLRLPALGYRRASGRDVRAFYVGIDR
jgi:hypothetical protein